MAELTKFDSLEEALVYASVCASQKDGHWKHTAFTRERIAKRVNIAEITVKVMLKTLLNKGALTKPKKAQYVPVDGFLSTPNFTQFTVNTDHETNN